MTGQVTKDYAKYDNFFKGLRMKCKRFDDILPNHRTDFGMLYFAACRSLCKPESAIRRTNNSNLTCRQAWLLRRIQRKLTQMVALWKKTVLAP